VDCSDALGGVKVLVSKMPDPTQTHVWQQDPALFSRIRDPVPAVVLRPTVPALALPNCSAGSLCDRRRGPAPIPLQGTRAFAAAGGMSGDDRRYCDQQENRGVRYRVATT
jgi:hypothetical protein